MRVVRIPPPPSARSCIRGALKADADQQSVGPFDDLGIHRSPKPRSGGAAIQTEEVTAASSQPGCARSRRCMAENQAMATGSPTRTLRLSLHLRRIHPKSALTTSPALTGAEKISQKNHRPHQKQTGSAGARSRRRPAKRLLRFHDHHNIPNATDPQNMGFRPVHVPAGRLEPQSGQRDRHRGQDAHKRSSLVRSCSHRRLLSLNPAWFPPLNRTSSIHTGIRRLVSRFSRIPNGPSQNRR